MPNPRTPARPPAPLTSLTRAARAVPAEEQREERGYEFLRDWQVVEAWMQDLNANVQANNEKIGAEVKRVSTALSRRIG